MYSWFGTTKTMKKELRFPEPLPRTAPYPISSGISHRGLPLASIKEIVNACRFYEEKCSGRYYADNAATRYVFQLSREVQTLCEQLSTMQSKFEDHVAVLESQIEQFIQVFRGAEDFSLLLGEEEVRMMPLTPETIRLVLDATKLHVKALLEKIAQLEGRNGEDVVAFEDAINQHRKASRERNNAALEQLQAHHNHEMKEKNNEWNQKTQARERELVQNFAALYQLQARRHARLLRAHGIEVPPTDEVITDEALRELQLSLTSFENDRKSTDVAHSLKARQLEDECVRLTKDCNSMKKTAAALASAEHKIQELREMIQKIREEEKKTLEDNRNLKAQVLLLKNRLHLFGIGETESILSSLTSQTRPLTAPHEQSEYGQSIVIDSQQLIQDSLSNLKMHKKQNNNNNNWVNATSNNNDSFSTQSTKSLDSLQFLAPTSQSNGRRANSSRGK